MTPHNDNNWVIHFWLKMLQFMTVMIWFSRMSWKYYQPFLGWVISYESHMTLKRYGNNPWLLSSNKNNFWLMFPCYLQEGMQNPAKNLWWSFFAKITKHFQPSIIFILSSIIDAWQDPKQLFVYSFRKKVPSYMSDRFLNTHLIPVSQGHCNSNCSFNSRYNFSLNM